MVQAYATAIAATDAKRESSNMREQLDCLDRELSALDLAIEALLNRIEPVMRPAPPLNAAPDAVKACQALGSVASEIRTKADHTANIRRRVEAATERLDL